MKLHIFWQRLVDAQGRTCYRCGMTETAVDDVVEKLKRSLRELNIDVILKKEILTPSTNRPGFCNYSSCEALAFVW